MNQFGTKFTSKRDIILAHVLLPAVISGLAYLSYESYEASSYTDSFCYGVSGLAVAFMEGLAIYNSIAIYMGAPMGEHGDSL